MVARKLAKRFRRVKLALAALAASSAVVAQDPPEVPPARTGTEAPPALSGSTVRSAVDEKALASTVEALVACGTRHSLSSWDDPTRGAGCGRNRVLERYRAIAGAAGG